MPATFIFFFVFAILALLTALASKFFKVGHRAGVTALIAGGLGLLFLIWASVAVVGTRDVGITTSFGKPVGTLENGVHFKAPWEKVSQLDGAIRTDGISGGWADEASTKCNSTSVRLAGNTIACVDNSVQWRINPASGDELFRDFHNDDTIRNSLVTRNLAAVLNEVFGAYNPLLVADDNGTLKDLDLTKISTDVTDALKARIGEKITVVSVIITQVHFDQNTQASLHRQQAAVGDNNTAILNQKTAVSQAAANDKLNASLTPQILSNRCLDILNAGKQLPAGFQCFVGAAGLPLTIPAR